MSSVEFVGPGDKPLPDESTISDVAWHGGFDLKLDGKQVSCRLKSGAFHRKDRGRGEARHTTEEWNGHNLHPLSALRPRRVSNVSCLPHHPVRVPDVQRSFLAPLNPLNR